MTEYPRRPGRATRDEDGATPARGLPDDRFREDESWGVPTGAIPSGLFRDEPGLPAGTSVITAAGLVSRLPLPASEITTS